MAIDRTTVINAKTQTVYTILCIVVLLGGIILWGGRIESRVCSVEEKAQTQESKIQKLAAMELDSRATREIVTRIELQLREMEKRLWEAKVKHE